MYLPSGDQTAPPKGLRVSSSATSTAVKSAPVIYNGVIYITVYESLFALELDGYFESEDWARTRDQIDAEIAQLAADSREAAHRVAEELRLLLESIREDARDGAHALEEEVAAIEQRIARLEVEGHEALVTSLRRLLDQIEAMAPSDGKPSDGKDAKEAG